MCCQCASPACTGKPEAATLTPALNPLVQGQQFDTAIWRTPTLYIVFKIRYLK